MNLPSSRELDGSLLAELCTPLGHSSCLWWVCSTPSHSLTCLSLGSPCWVSNILLLSWHCAAKLSQVCYSELVALEAHILYSFPMWNLANWHPLMKNNPGGWDWWGLMSLHKPTAGAMLKGRLSCCQAACSAPSWFLSSSTWLWLAVSNPLLMLVGGLALLPLTRVFGSFFLCSAYGLGKQASSSLGNCLLRCYLLS